MKIHYNPNLKQKARDLRNNSTMSEVLLWNELKARKILGYQFMRQKPIDIYIVDFYCSKLKLIIEIDGISHEGNEKKDRDRQLKLENLGLRLLRFSDTDVKINITDVVKSIVDWIENNKTTPFIPLY